MTVWMVYIKKMLGPSKPTWLIHDSFCDGSMRSVIKGLLFFGPTADYKSVTVFVTGRGKPS